MSHSLHFSFLLKPFFSLLPVYTYIYIHAYTSFFHTKHLPPNSPRQKPTKKLILYSTTNMGCAIPRLIYFKIIAALDGHDLLHQQQQQKQQHPSSSFSSSSYFKSSIIDGYQIVNASAVALAIPVFYFWLRPATFALQRAAVSGWRLDEG